MTPQFKKSIKALKTIPNLTVIATSWLSAQRDWPLPAVIVDLEKPVFTGVTEDGALTEVSTGLSMVFHVKTNEVDPVDALEALEQLVWKGLVALFTAFPDKLIIVESPEVDIMPFGKTQEAQGMGFALTISDGN